MWSVRLKLGSESMTVAGVAFTPGKTLHFRGLSDALLAEPLLIRRWIASADGVTFVDDPPAEPVKKQKVVKDG